MKTPRKINKPNAKDDIFPMQHWEEEQWREEAGKVWVKCAWSKILGGGVVSGGQVHKAQVWGTHGVYILAFLYIISSVAVEKDLPTIELYYCFITPKEIMDLSNDHQWLLTPQKRKQPNSTS